MSVAGIVSSAAVAFSSASQKLTMTSNSGDLLLVRNNSFIADEPGFYLVSVSIQCDTVRSEFSTTSYIGLFVNHTLTTGAYFQHRKDSFGSATLPQASTGNWFSQCNMLLCFFMQYKETITFQWTNYTGVVSACQGKFCIVKLNCIYNQLGNLTDTVGALINKTVQFNFSPIQNALLPVSNKWICPLHGLYLLTIFLVIRSANLPSFISPIIKIFNKSFTIDVLCNTVAVNTQYNAYINVSQILKLSPNDELTILFYNGGTINNTTAYNNAFSFQSLYTINKLF